jgi:hypothetical protein
LVAALNRPGEALEALLVADRGAAERGLPPLRWRI